MTHALPDVQALTDAFPCFRIIPEEEWAAAQPRIRTFPADTIFFRSEDAAQQAMFILSGTVQISAVTEEGREALSSRLSAGDICALMVLSGLSGREYPGAMTAETEVTALMISKNSFLRWLQRYEPVRHAVFGNLLDGLIRMGSLLSGKMSQPLEARLAGILLKMTSEREPTLRITHQQLAFELGTAREVISRILGRLQKQGWIATGRGSVTIKERKTLIDLVGDQVTEEEELPLIK